jgi:predicted  nucleic acid-binding Zn-ribbon protein
MSEEIKDVNAKIDQAEKAVKKYASKDTVISIGGYEFTPAKLMIAATIVSSTLGGLYGAFEVYKDYQSMKKKIAEYSAPDLSEFDKRLAVIEENSGKTSDYTRDIKNDLKNDIRRNETVTEQVERSVKNAQRETEAEMRAARKDVREDLDKARAEVNAIRKEMADARRDINSETQSLKREVNREVEALKKELDQKIQRAIDNPLAGK